MLCDYALIFFQTKVAPKFDLLNPPFDQLVSLFAKPYNTSERNIWLMADWDAI